MSRLNPLIALGLVFCPAVGLAQENGPSSAHDRGAEDATPPAPAGRTENLLDGVSFELSVEPEESRAAVQIGGYSSDTVFSGGGNARQTASQWSIKAEVPVGGSDDLTSESTLDALANGSKLTFDFSVFGFKSAAGNSSSRAFDRIMVSARENCKAEARNATDATPEEIDQQVIRCGNARNDPAFARRYSDYSDVAINRTLFSGIWRIGGEASIGMARFKFVSGPTLDEVERTKIQYSGAVFFAYYPSDAVSAVISRAEYQRAYKAADETIVCKPIVVDPSNDCVTAAPAAPQRTERLNLSLEYRRVFDSGWRRGSFAISPRAAIDALSGEFEAELPVYFIPRTSSPVSPGVRVSYSSEEEKLDFGLFLKSTFSF